MLKVGKGPRAAKLSACSTADAYGSYTAYYKASTRRSSDRSYPSFDIATVDASSVGHSNFSLFPGDLTNTFSDSPWSTGAVVTIKVRNQGKKKSRVVTVGALGAC